jgi:nucleoid DNA-binding protein
MADNKLSWTELRRTLASRADVSEKEANAFLNAFNTQLIEALKQDKQLKINGLGTFRLQAVAARKSVNVNTGEEMTIEGYNKIAFVPEAGLKELVEKGGQEIGSTAVALGLMETENEPMDPIKKLGVQAEEIVGILGELGQSPRKVESGKWKVESVQTDNEVVEPKEEEPVVEPDPVEEPVVEPKPIVEPEPEKPKYHFMRDTLICVVVLLMLLLIGYFFLRHELSTWMDELVKGQPETEVVQSTEESVQSTEVVQITEESVQTESEEVKEVEAWRFDEILTTEEITYGSRLSWIAKKHYGDKVYWPYIYEANKERIDNPSRIPVGTPIRVPKLSAAQRDTTDIRFIKIQEEAYGKMRE